MRLISTQLRLAVGFLALAASIFPFSTIAQDFPVEEAPRFPHLEARAETANLNDTIEIQELVADWRREWNVASGGVPSRWRRRSRNEARLALENLLRPRATCLSTQTVCAGSCCESGYPVCCAKLDGCCRSGYTCCSLIECCAPGYTCYSGICLEDIYYKTITYFSTTTYYKTSYTTIFGTTTKSYETTKSSYETTTVQNVATATSTQYTTRTTTVTSTEFMKRDSIPSTISIPSASNSVADPPLITPAPIIHMVDRHPHFDQLASKLEARGALVQRATTITFYKTVWRTRTSVWWSTINSLVTNYVTSTYFTTYTETEYDNAQTTEYVTSTLVVTEQVLVQVSTAPGSTVQITQTAEVIGSSLEDPTSSVSPSPTGGSGGGGDGGGGLALGAKIGIGVGAGIGALFLASVAGVLWRRHLAAKEDDMLSQPYAPGPGVGPQTAQAYSPSPATNAATLAAAMAAGGAVATAGGGTTGDRNSGRSSVPLNQAHLSYPPTTVSPVTGGSSGTPSTDPYYNTSRAQSGTWSPPAAGVNGMQQPQPVYGSGYVQPHHQQQQEARYSHQQQYRQGYGQHPGQEGGYFPQQEQQQQYAQTQGQGQNISPPQGYSEMADMSQGHGNTATQEMHGYSAGPPPPPAGYAEMGTMVGRETSPAQEMYAGENQSGRFREVLDGGQR